MPKFVIILCLAAVFHVSQASAKSTTDRGGNFGLGLMLGDPSAITGRYTVDTKTAYQGGVSFFYKDWTQLYFDWLHLFENGFGKQTEFISQTTPYIGAGAVAVLTSSDRSVSRRSRYFDSSDETIAIGVRVPIGAEWRPAQFPIGVFVELAPGLTILPGTYAFLQLGIGARYYF